MSSFGLYLASVSAPIAQRVLVGLGFGVVTYVGLDVVMTQIKDGVLANLGLIPADSYALLSLCGFPTAVGIVLGALTCRFSMIQLKSLQIL